MNVLVTGGAGFIGSHTLVQLVERGFAPIVFDNLSNSLMDSIDRVEQITGEKIKFVKGDIRNKGDLEHLFDSNKFDAVVHFAGLKAVGESVEYPLDYYENNVAGSLQLFEVMNTYGVKKVVFSSSATVYGDPIELPLTELMPTGVPTNPYGMSKLMIENILHSLYESDNAWSIVSLRYFNPVGAHESGLIGEAPSSIPNNLMPFITQAAIGKQPELLVFGADYDTHDGTGVRDFIHVEDLAGAHIKALEKTNSDKGIWAVNIGTGEGYSVLDMVKAFEKASGKKIPFRIVGRRAGDVGECYSDPSYAEYLLGWKAKRGIVEMCEDAWRWQVLNPNGYKK